MARKPTFAQDIDLPTLIAQYGSEDKCRAYLEALRWPNGLQCPRCGGMTISRIAKRGQFDCDSCRYQFSVTAGTTFHDSHLPLWKWFLAVYVIGESKKGISANQLKRMLGVSYKTAWYLSHRVRAAMRDEAPEELVGVVEADETYIGGVVHGGTRGRGHSPNRFIVLGAVERGGRVRLRVTNRVSKKNLHGFLNEVTGGHAEMVVTDALPTYYGIGSIDQAHATINHSQEWVQGDIHTQTIESVWSLFKRSILGSYHHLSGKHLPAYLDEMAFRYNNRENAYLFRDTLIRLISAEHTEYAELIAG
ncbi:MAG TPA: IS1595 family transposase [Candidatus Limnocylindrales bacterium]|nr:IS1595 family transposase [Candidatus Limnocylindrales bacterium]